MTTDGAGAVFLSYASQDAAAAQRVGDALRGAGLKVWLDQSALRGGDAWEEEIQRQIQECSLFIPIISRNTQERSEGYFRLEWKLAVDRSHRMAAERAFLIPVVVDEVSYDEALVPNQFRRSHWTHAPQGYLPIGLIDRITTLVGQPLPVRADDVGIDSRESEKPPAQLPSAPGDRRVHRQPPLHSHAVNPFSQPRLLKRGLIIAVAIGLVAVASVWINSELSRGFRNPLTNAKFSRLTDWSGKEQAASISRDAKMVAFLADHDGRTDVWTTELGSGNYRNLTQGSLLELFNPSIRTLGFSADGSLVTVWARQLDGSRTSDINVFAVPPSGGALRPYLPEAAEVSWSSNGGRIAYHTTAPGDPIFVKNMNSSQSQRIYTAPAGVHCHFPIWSPDDAFIYFARGIPPDAWDIWRIRPTGEDLERITFHNSRVSYPVLLDQRTLLYLASDPDGSGPWLYAADLKHRAPVRLGFGLERYTSLAASKNGETLVATIARPKTSLWSVSLSNEHPATTPLPIAPNLTGSSPRLGPGYVLFVSAQDTHSSIRKLVSGRNSELWSTSHATIIGAPTIARDGAHIAFTVLDQGKTLLYEMDSSGSHARILSRSLALRGNPSWSPDGKSVVSAAVTDGEPRLTTISLDGRAPIALASEYSISPVWSPNGQFLLYSGADLGTTFPLRAIGSDGRPYGLTGLVLTRGARRVVFFKDDQIVVLRGGIGQKNFWLVNLRTGDERQLTDFPSDFLISDFDVSPDGSQIVFDRSEETSEIAVIERSH